MVEITIECCGGIEKYDGQCLRSRCPHYAKAKSEIDQTWPYVGTGFGNLYGWPNHGDYLARVRWDLQKPEMNKG